MEFAHPLPLDSLRHVRAKIHGQRLDAAALSAVVNDIAAGRYSDIYLASFLTACGNERLDRQEMIDLTLAMVASGDRLDWGRSPVMDKHSVGGLPGNRTTLIVVPIVTAVGVTMPKTSSRAITSPAGTADTMEMLAPVELNQADLRRVVEQEGGCIAWGGAARLSPADDVLIRVERPLDLDSTGQLVASVLSKKAAAGATHVLIDLPVGPTAKIRSVAEAQRVSAHLREVGQAIGLHVLPVMTDGAQPVGRGLGPALEARDALAVLRGDPDAPVDLRERGCSSRVTSSSWRARSRRRRPGARARDPAGRPRVAEVPGDLPRAGRHARAAGGAVHPPAGRDPRRPRDAHRQPAARARGEAGRRPPRSGRRARPSRPPRRYRGTGAAALYGPRAGGRRARLRPGLRHRPGRDRRGSESSR